MKRTPLHKLVITLVLASLLTSVNFSVANAQSGKPNIILILADDISYGSLTCNGGNLYSTPNLDSMAQRGMRFTECHATPYCSPSRFQFLTGKYNFRNYVNWGDMDTAQRTIGNLMRDAGYKTACYGKWQFGGGDASVHALGFDNYCLYNAFDGGEKGDRYKSPTIYTNGDFVSSKRTENKYSEDIFADSVINFIDRNKSVPFFIYYPMALVHGPFQPTPDDTAFANWNPEESDESFYPSMVAYMDKKIGEIIAHLKEIGLDKNTVVIYSGDNGSSKSVGIYRAGDSTVYGGKSITTEAGTRVPLIVFWDGKVIPGTVNNDLIDFTDVLPTVADIAHIPVPASYGPIDGISFAPRLTGNAGTPRDWIFYHYDPHPGYNTYKRWAQTATYKLYDTSSYNSQRLFYNIANDPDERFPIPDSLLSGDEAQLKQNFLGVFTNYIQQGFALFEPPVAFTTTDSSTLVHDTIDIDGGSGITARGVVWSENHNPTLSSGNYTLDGTGNGIFGTVIPGLKSNTTYYVRTYATNIPGTAYSKETSFTTARAFPVATAATAISENSFTANWDQLTGATGYMLDVSKSPTFSTNIASNLTEGFDSGNQTEHWFINPEIRNDSVLYGVAPPSLRLRSDGVRVISDLLAGPATQLRFWIKGSGPGAGSLLVEGFNGLNWVVVDNIVDPPYGHGFLKTYGFRTTPSLDSNFIKFRFTFHQAAGAINLDDVSINYNVASPSFLPGYHQKPVTGTSDQVTVLLPQMYYYRVTALYDTVPTGYSNVIAVRACSKAVINNVLATNLTCNNDGSGAISLDVTGNNLVYHWSGVNGFTSTRKDIEKLSAGDYSLIINSNGGCPIDTSVTLTEPPILQASATAGEIAQVGGTAMVTITANGGTPAYAGTGDFSQSAGTTKYVVTDAHGCKASVSVSLTNPAPAGILLFPNPTLATVKMIFPLKESGQCTIKITDVTGKVLLNRQLDGLAGGNVTELDLRGFAPGTYMVSLVTNDERRTIKLIKAQ